MHFAEVAVDTKIPSIGKTYTYAIPEELRKLAEPGKYVNVPFGRKTLQGVILSISNKKPEYAVKEIKLISPDPPVLSLQGLAIAQWLSLRYGANFFESLASMLPKEGKSKRTTKAISSKVKALEKDLPLTKSQKAVFSSMQEIFFKQKNKKILLHGVTGSGKTEIYLQIARQVLATGKQVLFMVPEIALTPQLIGRFTSRFGENEIAIVHSHIQNAQKKQYWQEIKEKKKHIVIGSRSAILSPFADLGMIIIDECHEQSYKQDKNPKYNAIELAMYLSDSFGIPFLMGSATPLVEQYYMAEKKRIHLLNLPERISGIYPTNIVIDLKKEKELNNYSLLSLDLQIKLKNSLSKSEQSLLYFNRRGIHSGLMCTKCGSYELCPKCSMPLTIHQKKDKTILVCHYCFFTKDLPHACSVCTSKFIKGVGKGTQTVLSEITKLFPQTQAIIMDKDTTIKKGSHEKIFHAFANHEADILIGTQMITKGWDISNVSLTGYLLLDSDLIFPSFRTSERVYQLITQFAGRSARGNKSGINIIQTYNPQNQLLQNALKGNYEDFYREEIKIRKNLFYPPFVNLIQIIAKDKSESKAYKSIKSFTKIIEKALSESSIKYSFIMLGPSKCFLPKVNNEYFFQLTIKLKTIPVETSYDEPNDIYTKLNIKNPTLREALRIINALKRPTGLSINIDPFDLQ